MTTINIQAVRQTITAQRKLLDPDRALAHAIAIKDKLIKLPCYHHAKKVGLYMSYGGEVDTSLLIKDALARHKQVYLPILHHLHGPALLFAPFNEETHLKYNKFHIHEPVSAFSKRIKPKNLDLVITPLVAFDTNCARVGMGSGYYDRSFAFIDHSRQWQHPKLIGLAYEFQKIEDCNPNAWDIPLHNIVTEKTLYTK
ncbi:5-formyltetrahydrofolate cyclo-ligase [hydrothermal vent metagenome]|uniref:5-formyltetrahydrofolate cyclo-ligase n=1 Tax=hydrothermal vent metagenome TaxID=652676 RepID=A0A3B0Z191_9ZZZZ